MQQDNKEGYMQTVGRTITEHNRLTMKVTESALSFLDLTQDQYVKSIQTAARDPSYQKSFEQSD